MDTLSIDQLHQLRLAIYKNASELHKEASTLFEHKMWPRSYLLAHFCIEELGKLPIIVGAIGLKIQGKPVDWGRVRKRFYDHKHKIKSHNFHYYMFGLDVDLLKDSDLMWLNDANAKVDTSYKAKNSATYVDVSAGTVSNPLEVIGEQMAKNILSMAEKSLRAHEISEKLSNPFAANDG